jgi:hypothetical protein
VEDGVSELSLKLRLTAAALGCGGMKDLGARFRAVNPATHFDVERAQKWVQGRAHPRFAQIYEDWARVIGTSRSGGWIAACGVDAFLQELGAVLDADPEALRRRVEGAPAAAVPRAGPVGHPLVGDFACYSPAWSPYQRGRIIRGALRLDPPAARGGAMTAAYTEALLNRPVAFRGTAWLAARTLHMDLREADSGAPLLFSLFAPGPPASALCGVMSGSVIVGPDQQPCASAFVAVRVPADPVASNRYVDATPGAIARDLAALGLPLSDPAEVDALLRDTLLPGRDGAPFLQISAERQARVVALLDHSYVAAGS